MKSLLQVISEHARLRPSAPALAGNHDALSYAGLVEEIARLQQVADGQVIGLLLDNSPAWVLLDLVAQSRGAICVPLPDFFSDAQLAHIIDTTGMDRVFTDQPLRMKRILARERVAEYRIASQPISQFSLPLRRLDPPLSLDKLTFTSGTSAQPKGVCLDNEVMLRVAHSLSQQLGAGPGDRFLSLLPLATLLENISVYAALLAGATVCLPGAQQTGVGVTYLDISKLCTTISACRPGMMVLVPQMLKALLAAVDSGWTPPGSLRFIAVGGAAVAPSLLQRASDRGLPVFEGYGLSEASSVVSLNLPGACRPGSVGKPLPHVRLRIAADGEIQIAGTLFQGYLDEETGPAAFWPSGDLGHLDDDGFLYLDGRKNNLIITAYGRNLSPEWPERELLAQPEIAQAIVLGDARPFNIALIVPMPGSLYTQLQQAVHRANVGLPEYARISAWHICPRPFTTAEDELSANGRPRRAIIQEHYMTEIAQLYQEQKHAVL